MNRLSGLMEEMARCKTEAAPYGGNAGYCTYGIPGASCWHFQSGQWSVRDTAGRCAAPGVAQAYDPSKPAGGLFVYPSGGPGSGPLLPYFPTGSDTGPAADAGPSPLAAGFASNPLVLYGAIGAVLYFLLLRR